ncbi:MAG: hypothetical protein AAB074_11425 [Planctomycetota bacterium]
MRLFGPKRISCPGGQWTTVLKTSFAQMPKSWSVHFEGEPRGEFEEKKSAWIFPGTPKRGPLSPEMTFYRGYWNTFFIVRVCPAADIVAVVD